MSETSKCASVVCQSLLMQFKSLTAVPSFPSEKLPSFATTCLIHTSTWEFELEPVTQKTRNCFAFTLRQSNLKTQKSPVLDFCLRKTCTGKSHGYQDYTVIEKFRFQNVFCRHKDWCYASVFKFLQFKERFRKAPFHVGLAWMVDQTVDIKG